jgi:hypothetical protein
MINRELAALKEMLKIWARQTPLRVDKVRYVSMLNETAYARGSSTMETI